MMESCLGGYCREPQPFEENVLVDSGPVLSGGFLVHCSWWLEDKKILIRYSHGYVWGGYRGVCYKELHTFQITLSAPV